MINISVKSNVILIKAAFASKNILIKAASILFSEDLKNSYAFACLTR